MTVTDGLIGKHNRSGLANRSREGAYTATISRDAMSADQLCN